LARFETLDKSYLKTTLQLNPRGSFTSICGLKVSSYLFAKQPLQVLKLPTTHSHFAQKDLNFPKLQKDPFPFAFKFLNTYTQDQAHNFILKSSVF
jgi:hypothetical protein